MQVEIEYCVPCGLIEPAIEMQQALLSRFGERLDAVRLKAGSGGIFAIRADGELIFDKARDGYNLEAIVSAVGSRLASS
jgi:selenoprotein W-related protein